MTRARAPTGLLRVVIVLIGAHSLVLGLAVLTAPRDFTRLVGLPEAASTFFPSQSGAFLVALGLCYLLALRDRALVWTILVSKSIAVVFLLVHFLFLGAPPSVLAAAALDFAMLAVTVGAWVREGHTHSRSR
jgi:hypothetical protein